MCSSTTLGPALRSQGPGLYAVLDFHARRRYGRSLDQLPPQQRLSLAKEVLGERAEHIAHLLSSGESEEAGDVPIRLQRLYPRRASPIMVL